MRLECILVIVCTHPYKMTSIVMSHDIRGIRLCLWCTSTGLRVMWQHPRQVYEMLKHQIDTHHHGNGIYVYNDMRLKYSRMTTAIHKQALLECVLVFV